jgi:hypothetical protein
MQRPYFPGQIRPRQRAVDVLAASPRFGSTAIAAAIDLPQGNAVSILAVA